jgi:hypothetical protein
MRWHRHLQSFTAIHWVNWKIDWLEVWVCSAVWVLLVLSLKNRSNRFGERFGQHVGQGAFWGDLLGTSVLLVEESLLQVSSIFEFVCSSSGFLSWSSPDKTGLKGFVCWVLAKSGKTGPTGLAKWSYRFRVTYLCSSLANRSDCFQKPVWPLSDSDLTRFAQAVVLKLFFRSVFRVPCHWVFLLGPVALQWLRGFGKRSGWGHRVTLGS